MLALKRVFMYDLTKALSFGSTTMSDDEIHASSALSTENVYTPVVYRLFDSYRNQVMYGLFSASLRRSLYKLRAACRLCNLTLISLHRSDEGGVM
jgi:hypothetical protein